MFNSIQTWDQLKRKYIYGFRHVMPNLTSEDLLLLSCIFLHPVAQAVEKDNAKVMGSIPRTEKIYVLFSL